MKRFDVIVVGQGLAGTALTWRLLWRGLRVCVIDSDAPSSPSKVAAGLVTPVTGRRFALDADFDRYHCTAIDHYRRVERETDTQLYQPTGAVRAFGDESERQHFLARADDLKDVATVSGLDAAHLSAFERHGGIRMPTAGRLDCRRYLDVSGSTFEIRATTIAATLNHATDVTVTVDEVMLPRLDVAGEVIVWCTGWDRMNPWYADIEFTPAKGETLTVHIPGWTETRTVHVAGIWVYRIADGMCRVGATYDRDRLDAEPTAVGQAELLDRLRLAGIGPVSVVGHDAAVRPVTFLRTPVACFHPSESLVAIFTGLSSKGVLTAPFLAERLAEQIAEVGSR